MKVNTFTSVGAKLFYYMTLLVLITLAGNSYQYIHTFLGHQKRQLQDQIQLQVENAGNQIESVLSTWQSQIAVAIPAMRTAANADLKKQSQIFVDSNSEFIAIGLYESKGNSPDNLNSIATAFTSATGDARFEDRDPAATALRMEKAARVQLARSLSTGSSVDNDDRRQVLMTLGQVTRLPIIALAVRFDVADSDDTVWAILYTWQTNIIRALPKSQFISSFLADASSRTFSSPNGSDLINYKKIPRTKLAERALQGQSPSGFEGDYQGADQQRKVGGFTKLAKYGLTLIVEMSSDSVYSSLKKSLYSTALWASLFILIAVMFAFLGAAGITKGLRNVAYATSRIARGDLKYRIKPSSNDEVGMLGLAVNHMSDRILRLMHVQIDKARFEKELETAKMVQSTFFPKKDIKSGPFFATGFYEPASECGGDLWGHFSIDEHRQFLFIADAMGHGAPAALVTAMAYSTTMTLADIFKDNPDFKDSPAKVLDRLNRIIHEAVEGSISMTFFASILDLETGVLTYSNAGHNFPFVLPASGDDDRGGRVPKSLRKISDVTPISLKIKGTPLGIDPEATFKSASLTLRPGDKLFYYTDGLIECSSPDGNVWGRKQLLEQILSTSKKDANAMKDEIVQRAFKFFDKKPLDDDITIVVAELDKAWLPKVNKKSHEQDTKTRALKEASTSKTALPLPPGASPMAIKSADLPPLPSGLGIDDSEVPLNLRETKIGPTSQIPMETQDKSGRRNETSPVHKDRVVKAVANIQGDQAASGKLKKGDSIGKKSEDYQPGDYQPEDYQPTGYQAKKQDSTATVPSPPSEDRKSFKPVARRYKLKLPSAG